jgi:hypothetical protein
MHLDRLLPDPEHGGELLVAVPAREKGQKLAFARRQPDRGTALLLGESAERPRRSAGKNALRIHEPSHREAGLFPEPVAEALPNLRHSLELDTRNFILQWTIGYAYAAVGRLDEAARHAAVLNQMGSDVPLHAPAGRRYRFVTLPRASRVLMMLSLSPKAGELPGLVESG